ncbi:type IV secretion system DNA-binding domain-containing protein [Francisella sciaenopsi]|uniref:Type IV secretion system coupling protein TraD DNA-binding domain-containing protein n=1 Tax=Francisella sciaenopsi TaxID=3055034 RepID=A0ABQ6PEZ5_9GAMM
MKNQNMSRNRSTIGITFYLAVSLPIISCIVILLSYNIDELDIVLSTISSLVDYSGFKTDGGWYFRLLLLLPVISISHYIGFKMLQNQETTFEIQLLQGLSITLYTIIISIFFIGVGWVLAVYVTRAFSYMHFFGNPIERFNQIISVNPYLSAYDLLSNYIWTNIAIFYIVLLVLIIIQSVLSKTLYAKKIEPFFAGYISHKANKNMKDEGLTSSEQEYNYLMSRVKDTKKYLPTKYFKKDQTFIAKDVDTNKPVYIDDGELFRKELPHFAIIGASGKGKGSFSQTFLCQMVLKGYPVVVFDPNDDTHMMKNLKDNAEKSNRNFHWINFKEYLIPQIDVLQKCSPYEFEELISSVFPYIEYKDSDGNYHNQFSRDAVFNYYVHELDNVECMYDLHQKIFNKYGEDALKSPNGELPQFVNEFLSLSKRLMVKVSKSISIKEAIEVGDVIYISCPRLNKRTELAVLCSMFMMRVVQILQYRDEDSKHVFMFMDEFPSFANLLVKESIEQLRKKACTMLVNMTSFESLVGIRTDVDGQAVMNAIITNSIKLIYQQPNRKISKSISDMTGTKVVYKENKVIKRNSAMKEIEEVTETIKVPVEVNVFSATLIENLPSNVALMLSYGLPRIVQTEVFKYAPDVKFPTVLQAEPYSVNDSETNSEDDNDIMGAL